VALLTSSARAEFLNNYAAWQQQSATIQAGFVEGVYDHAMAIGTPEYPAGIVMGFGLGDCGARVRFTSGQLAQAVSDAYRVNPQIWGQKATVVTWYALVRICESDINHALVNAKLPTISAQGILENLGRAR
jgi:hypothetical protein